MAGITVPNPYGQNVAIGPTNGLGGLHEAPETKYGLDKVVGGAAKEVAGAVSRWQDEIDRTNAKDAINKTQQQLRDLETNQENGWANILGENALKRPDGKSLVDEYQLKAKEVIDTQLSELKTSAARKYFERYAETAYQQNGNRLQTHLINQQKIYDKAVSAATIKTAQDDIRSGDLARMRSGFAVLEAEYQNLANKTGLPVDRYETVGAMHAIAIENFIDGKNPDAAAAWLEANRSSMSSEQIKQARELIKEGKTSAAVDSETQRILSNPSLTDAQAYKTASDIKDREVREKVVLKIGQELTRRQELRRLEVEELKDQAMQITLTGEELPASLLNDLRERDVDVYEKVLSDNFEVRMSGMSSADIARAAKTGGAPRLQKSAQAIVKKRSADPVGVAVDSGLYGFEALNISSPEAMLTQLQNRADNIQNLSNWYGTEPAMFSKAEKEALNNTLDEMSPLDCNKFLQKMTSGLPAQALYVMAKQLGGTTSQTILLQADAFTSGVASTYLRGKQALGEKQVAVSWIESNATLGTKNQWDRLNGLYDDPQVREHVMDAVEGVAAGYIIEGSATMSTAFEKAFKAVIGDIEEYNGRKVALRNGVTLYDVRRTVVAYRNRLRNEDKEFAKLPNGQTMSGKQFGTFLMNAQLMPAPEGDNSFYVVAGDSYLYDTKNQPIVITVETAR